jgi:hypothetical protein
MNDRMQSMYRFEATTLSPIHIYYCKAGLRGGTPVRVMRQGIVYESGKVEIIGAQATMWHDNSEGKAKRSGARCVLILTAGRVEFVGLDVPAHKRGVAP